MDIQKLMKQAEQMQQRMQEELDELEVEAAAGGGMVTARMNGHKQLLAVTLDPEVIDPEDTAMLQDLIVAAVNEAARRVDEESKSKLGGMIPGLSGLPGLG